GSGAGGIGQKGARRGADDGGGGAEGGLARPGSNGDMAELRRSFDSALAAAGGHQLASMATEKPPPGAAAEGDLVHGGSITAGPPVDNWGILQYGLTLEDPVAGHGSDAPPPAAVAAAADGTQRGQHLGETVDSVGQSTAAAGGGGGSGGGGGDQFSAGDAGGGTRGSGRLRDGGASSSSSASVAMMMGSLSIGGDQSAADQRYGGRGDLGRGGRGGRGQPEDGVVFADDYDLVGPPDGGGGGSFGFLDTPPPSNYEPRHDDRAPLQPQQQPQQQEEERQQSTAPPTPLLPRRGVGGSPSLAPQRRRLPHDVGGFPASG
ncbi:unnamed protein product, partial [Ectocarpus fasciculatus]